MKGRNYKEFTDPTTARQFRKVFIRILSTGRPVKSFDYKIIGKDNHEKIISMSTGLLKSETGLDIGFRGIARDVTDRKLAEEKIRRMNDELERRVNERTSQLNEANIALKSSLQELKETQNHLVQTEKMAALGSLVAGIAHEINTPVGIGVTAASLLEEKTSALWRMHQNGVLK